MGVFLWGFESPLRHLNNKMQNRKGKIAVFLSGRGSNFDSIYKDSLKHDSNYNIELVISDNPDADGLVKSREYGLNTFAFKRSDYVKKKEFELAILDVLNDHKIDLICLAGYMRLIGKTLLKKYEKRIINIHPSLLPSFPGLNAQKQAYDYGVKFSGCTVHFVNSGIDTGQIISQSIVEVLSSDTLFSLSKKILEAEHIVYPKSIRKYFKTMELK